MTAVAAWKELCTDSTGGEVLGRFWAEVLEEAGATVVLPAAESGLRWTVTADPEGGEFRAFDDDRMAP